MCSSVCSSVVAQKTVMFLEFLGGKYGWLPLVPLQNFCITRIDFCWKNRWRISVKNPAYLYGKSNFQLAPNGMKIGVYPFLGPLTTNLKTDFQHFLALLILSNKSWNVRAFLCRIDGFCRSRILLQKPFKTIQNNTKTKFSIYHLFFYASVHSIKIWV